MSTMAASPRYFHPSTRFPSKENAQHRSSSQSVCIGSPYVWSTGSDVATVAQPSSLSTHATHARSAVRMIPIGSAVSPLQQPACPNTLHLTLSCSFRSGLPIDSYVTGTLTYTGGGDTYSAHRCTGASAQLHIHMARYDDRATWSTPHSTSLYSGGQYTQPLAFTQSTRTSSTWNPVCPRYRRRRPDPAAQPVPAWPNLFT